MIRPDEATLIINGWFESKTELLLSASMINFSVYAKCRVVDVSAGKVTLRSAKNDSVFTFTVDSPHLSLRFSMSREFKGLPGLESLPEDKWEKSALVVTLSLEEIEPSYRDSGFRAEQIILLEI